MQYFESTDAKVKLYSKVPVTSLYYVLLWLVTFSIWPDRRSQSVCSGLKVLSYSSDISSFILTDVFTRGIMG